ncbi:MAG: Holliday junction branch migration protein RuvA [Candidatus Cloacimonetes bacterium]|nr:Holliday junction branch migration protein RuvA [Candidatus Cloacimonadota bacterium]
MINYIKGTLVHKSPVKAVVETAMGLAFELLIPISTFEVLPAEGQPCQLFTHLHIAQDDVRLFGFATPAECELYQQLNRISGVGPKSALSIISTLPIPTFVKAIEREESALLTKVPGIGLKSAQRLVIELKGKLRHLMDYAEPGDMEVGESTASEVENALETLGFNARDVRRELALMGEEAARLNSEQLIREVIRRLYQRSR